MMRADDCVVVATIELRTVATEDREMECPVLECGAILTAGMVAVLVRDGFGDMRVACDDHWTEAGT